MTLRLPLEFGNAFPRRRKGQGDKLRGFRAQPQRRASSSSPRTAASINVSTDIAFHGSMSVYVTAPRRARLCPS